MNNSIFIVKVEQYLLRSKRKRLRKKKFTLFIIHVLKCSGGGKGQKNSINLVHSGD